MKTALLALLLAFPAAAEDLKCEPRKDLARALSEKWGETTVFTGAGPNGGGDNCIRQYVGNWTHSLPLRRDRRLKLGTGYVGADQSNLWQHDHGH